MRSIGHALDSATADLESACYMLYDEGRETLRNVRLEYDVEAAMRRIRAAGLPEFLAERLQWGE